MAVKVVIVLAYLILAPFVGGLLDGLDRIISARMQRRKGPSILQPFYDLGKLFSKQLIAVNNVQLLLNLSYLVILMIAGAMLFAGADLLMVLFILSTADMFLIMAASSDSSPYANMGASREMMQMMAYGTADTACSGRFLSDHRIFPCGRYYSAAGQRGSVDAGSSCRLYVYSGNQVPEIALRPFYQPSCPSGNGKRNYHGNVRIGSGNYEYCGIL